MPNWNDFDREEEGRVPRPRLFETLEEPDYETHTSRSRKEYSSSRRLSDDRADRFRDDYSRSARTERPIRPSYDDYVGNGNVTLYKPKSFSEVQSMIDNLSNKSAVIVKLEAVEPESAQRILDFLSGAAYALGGSMRRIEDFTFLITPQGTGITDTDDSHNR